MPSVPGKPPEIPCCPQVTPAETLAAVIIHQTTRMPVSQAVDQRHGLSIAFQHPPPNSTRTGCAGEGVLFISAQLSSDAVSALRKVWVLIRL